MAFDVGKMHRTRFLTARRRRRHAHCDWLHAPNERQALYQICMKADIYRWELSKLQQRETERPDANGPPYSFEDIGMARRVESIARC